jgi:hypothetical protein
LVTLAVYESKLHVVEVGLLDAADMTRQLVDKLVCGERRQVNAGRIGCGSHG